MADILEIVITAKDGTKEAFASLNDNLKESNQGGISLGGTFKALGVAALALGAVIATGITATVKESLSATMDWGEQLEALTKQFGMSGEAASGYGVLAQHVGLTIDEMSFGLNYFTRQLNTAQTSQENFTAGLDKNGKALKKGATEALDPFSKAMQKLGISMFDAKGQAETFDQLMPQIMDKFSKLPEGIDASALAMDMFGARGGSKFLEFLRAGGVGMDQWNQKAKDMGLEMSTKTITDVEELGRTFNDLKGYVQGFFVTIGTALLPGLKSIADTLEKDVMPKVHALAADISDAIKTGNWDKVKASLGDLMHELGQKAQEIWNAAQPELLKLLEAFNKWVASDGVQNVLKSVGGSIGGAIFEGFKDFITNIDWGQQLIDTERASMARQQANLMKGGLAGMLGLAGFPGFQTEPGEMRVIPGAANEPVPILAHGGEVIGRPGGGGGASIVVHLHYAPALSLGDTAEFQRNIQPFIEKGIVAARARQIGATR